MTSDQTRQRPSERRAALIGISIGAALVLLLVALLLIARLAPDSAKVTITSCGPAGDGYGTVSYELTNTTGSTRSFLVRFEALDSSGARVGEGSDFVSDLRAGQSVRGEVTLLVTGSPARCAVSSLR